MSLQYDEKNVYDTVFPYRVIRNVRCSDGGTYHVQMNLKAGMDQKYAEGVLDLVDGLGLVYPVPDTEPQLFKLRIQGLVETWYSLWEEEIEHIPVNSEDFDKFLERYIKSYLETERNSTVREMLVKDFFWGMKTLDISEEEEFLDPSFKEFESRLEERYESGKHAHEHVQEAMGFREEKGVRD